MAEVWVVASGEDVHFVYEASVVGHAETHVVRADVPEDFHSDDVEVLLGDGVRVTRSVATCENVLVDVLAFF